MLKKEFLRYFKSGATLISLGLLIALSIPSILSSIKTRDMFLEQLAKPEPGLTADGFSHMESLIRNYTGIRFYFDFISLSEFYTYGYILVLMAWIGVFLSSNLHVQKENGQGNFIVTRSSHKKHIASVLFAQSCCIVAVVLLSSILILMLCLVMGGTHFETVLAGDKELTLFPVICIIMAQIFLISIFACAVNAVCSLLSAHIHNRYVVQALPLCGFTLGPFVLCSTVANLFPPIGGILLPFIPFEFSQSITNYLNSNTKLIATFHIATPLILYLIVAAILLRENLKKDQENYI